jgi:hypothetical protein
MTQCIITQLRRSAGPLLFTVSPHGPGRLTRTERPCRPTGSARAAKPSPVLRPSSESTAPLTSDPDDERCRQHADHDAASRAGTPRGTTRGGPPANRVLPRPGASGPLPVRASPPSGDHTRGLQQQPLALVERPPEEHRRGRAFIAVVMSVGTTKDEPAAWR